MIVFKLQRWNLIVVTSKVKKKMHSISDLKGPYAKIEIIYVNQNEMNDLKEV